MKFSEDLLIHEAREIYFAKSGFSADTYTDKWARFPLGPFSFYLPNFKARREAVPLHDIDHILTEYSTDWKGEMLISGYEVGTGCGKYWAGWLINLQGLLPAAILFPRETLKAFARGRRSRGVFGFADYKPLLEKKLGVLRDELSVPRGEVEVSSEDFFAFFGYLLLSMGMYLTVPLLILGFVFG
ncbi:MAG: hypothetical protein AB7O96_18895 [Pseudobdellovibrionaceae bacterium]